jgi:hypothetical protein
MSIPQILSFHSFYHIRHAIEKAREKMKNPAHRRGSNGRFGRLSQYSQVISLHFSSRHSLQPEQ